MLVGPLQATERGEETEGAMVGTEQFHCFVGSNAYQAMEWR